MKVIEDGEKIDLSQNDWPLKYNKLEEDMGNEVKPHELHCIEFLFKDEEIPPWQSQLTLRAVVASCAMGAFLTIFVVKMDLMFGMIPPVNLFAGFFGFLFISTWTKLLSAAGFQGQPFTRQENAVIQICVNAIISIAYSGGFASYLFAMSDIVAKQMPGPVDPSDIKNPSFGWMTLLLLLSSSAGVFTPLPLRNTKSGDWYPAKVAPRTLSGLQAYKVFIGLSIIIGDGVYNLIKIIVVGLLKHKNNSALPVAANSFTGNTPASYDEEVRSKAFLKDQIPKRVAIGGYVVIATISVAVLPFIFPSLKWYHVLTLYLISPLLGFCRVYVTALTDMSVSSVLGRMAILIFGSWTGMSSGSVLAGLAACGALMHLVDAASNMMETFKLGYMTLSSPKSLFLSQLIGTLVGCLVSPYIFLYFKNHYPNGFGTPDSMFPASWASSQRAAAMRATNGFSTLPKHCLSLSLAFFFVAILVSLLRDSMPKKWKHLIPIPMAFAVPFNVGAYLSIDMCVGYLVFYLWRRKNKAQAEALAPFVGSALMFGDGLWWFPSTILRMRNIIAPMCMRFLSKEMSAQVENCLNGGS
ncbi:probable metal-nicotianamine transporter YSL7 [Rhodamnia argentea]|uniref:Probable metal-nicotianamine transporter YSL7 n=1 Tax=Rhodamnia argentea TaxID=178133 RepID=A0ABM3HJ30_9MYRT|nr:probable metal-nicotianamine transporter YSL7 [Rhodamnia argentea]